MEFAVLLIVGELDHAAKLQRRLMERAVASYWAINTDAGWRALGDVDPTVVVIDHATNAEALSFFSLLAEARPHVHRVLLTHVSPSLFARERSAGLVDSVVFEHTLPDLIDGLSLADPRAASRDEPLDPLLPTQT